MRFLLIRPDIKEIHLDTRDSTERLGDLHQPLGLLYLGTSLQNCGAEVKICDEIVEDDPFAFIEEFKPEYLGITVTTPMFERTIQIVKFAKERGIKVILGGPHITPQPEKTLQESGADAVCYGEGETTIVEWITKPPSEVLGIAYMENGNVKLNPPRPLAEDLDAIPIPDRNLLNIKKYLNDEEFGWPLRKGRQVFRIFSSRGCPFQCTFCASWRTFGRKIRFRSAANLLEEIKLSLEKFDVNHFMFIDDTLTEDRKRLREICEGMKKIGNIYWSCYSRVGLSLEELTLMKESGCELIGFGVEHGSPKVLKLIKKAITREKVEETFKLVKKAGIPSKAFFMVGLPGEDEEEFKISLDFAKKLNAPFVWISILIPLPGTEIYENYQSSSDFLAEVNRLSYFHTDNPVISKRHAKFIREYYLRPGYLLNLLYYRGFRYWGIFWKMAQAYLRYKKHERKKNESSTS
ncbi:MAG: radical SAM protein [Candidatus Coatesbacteria bacterium]|nr:radical SAM protein [Candidatus Coatesbacteria bacterium]